MRRSKARLARLGEEAVRHVVARQVAAGIDVVNDGEQPRVGFQTYVAQRMKGFGGESKRPSPTDYTNFPIFAERWARLAPRRGKVRNAPQAVAEVVYDDLSPAEEECRLFKAALAGQTVAPVETFMTAPSPGIIATTLLNAHYDTYEAYVFALAREIAKEYRLIAGDFILQIDAPDLAMERTTLFQEKSIPEFVAIAEMHVAALNEALAGIPRDRVRLHCCWGNWEGPHVDDIPMRDILPVLYQARVGGLSIEFANPHHQHEYAALKQAGLPDGFILLPGVIDSTTNFVEHPEVIANRLCEAVDAVGDRSRVIASTDCGFATFAGGEMVAEDVVWAKLRACRDGADIATRRLWGQLVTAE